jgi:hypothetical protein
MTILCKEFCFVTVTKAASTTMMQTLLSLMRKFKIKEALPQETGIRNTLSCFDTDHIKDNAAWGIKPIAFKDIDGKFSTKFSFGFVRNPYDRIVSTYSMFVREGKLKMRFDDFVNILPEIIENYGSVAYGDSIISHITPQHIFLEGVDGNLGVNYVGYFEKIYHDWNQVITRLEIIIKQNLSAYRHLPIMNKTVHFEYKKYFNEELAEKIYDIYKKDFEMFGYDKDSWKQ